MVHLEAEVGWPDLEALDKIDFGFYLSLFLRRLPLFLSVALLAGAVLVSVTLLWPPSYQATAKVLVESPQIPIDLAKSTVPTSAGEQFQVIQQDVLSRDSLLALADRFGIYADQTEMERSARFDDLTRRISIVPTPISSGDGGQAATVFSISFKADQPELAANFVNALVSMILNKDVQLRTARATDTVAFFTKETESLSEQLKSLDSRLLAFKNENLNALPDSIDFRRNQQTVQQQRLLALSQEEAALRKRQNDLTLRPLAATATAATPEEQNLIALRQNLTEQQALFAENSPTILALRKRIATLEASMAAPASTGNGGPLTSREMEMADIKERLLEVAEERASVQASITELVRSIALTPSNETALNSMERDHQNLQAQYDSAIARLAEASTGQQIELLLKGERLLLIESAIPPQFPQGPGRRLLLLASVLCALALGLAAVIIPELLSRRIRRPAELVNRLQIVPYITVPYITNAGGSSRRVAMGLATLITIPTLLWAVETNVSPLRDVMNRASTPISSTISKL